MGSTETTVVSSVAARPRDEVPTRHECPADAAVDWRDDPGELGARRSKRPATRPIVAGGGFGRGAGAHRSRSSSRWHSRTTAVGASAPTPRDRPALACAIGAQPRHLRTAIIDLERAPAGPGCLPETRPWRSSPETRPHATDWTASAGRLVGHVACDGGRTTCGSGGATSCVWTSCKRRAVFRPPATRRLQRAMSTLTKSESLREHARSIPRAKPSQSGR